MCSKDVKIELLKDKYEKINSVLSAHQIALWEYDITIGSFDYEDNYFQVLGLKETGIFFKDIKEFYHCIYPNDLSSYKKSFFELIDPNSNTSEVLVRCTNDHGKIVWLEEHLLSYKKNENGLPVKVIGYTINVTARCEKEMQIRHLEERNKKIIEALPEFIFIFDENFFIRDVLMAQKTVLLHPVEELRNKDGRSIYSPEVSDLFIRNIKECLSDGQIKEIEYPLDTKDQRYYFQARIAPFEERKVLALIHDIGERVKRSEEMIEAKCRAEEADRMKSFFLANMSHEIRTPLNAIVGFSEIIALIDDPIEKQEYVRIIQKNNELLLQLINDILDLSRLESGKNEMHMQTIDATGFLQEIAKTHQIKMKNEVILEVLHSRKEILFSTDRNRVMQILFNFLSNAIKNTEKGSITLGLSEENNWLKFYVSDTGCGIPKEKISLIFNRFEKLNDFSQGTGLGLSICKSIAERLGGKIEVESIVGQGSTFTLFLPFFNIERENEKSKSRKKILVAEDLEANFLQLRTFLEKEYTIMWVRNGEEAVSSFLHEKPDLILMDIQMPIMNGIEAIERIRTISAEIPIIAATTHTFYTEKKQALSAGSNDIISKPYSIDQIRNTIKRYI